MNLDTVLKYGSKLIVLFLCIPIHEYAHAWAATKLGDPTPKYQGRLSLNPLAHLDIWGSLMIFFLGFGWGKPVQVNPMNFKNYRKGSALTSAAGPISNLIVSFFSIIIFKVFAALYYANFTEGFYWAALIFQYISILNLGLAVFNLIPIYPLDGQKIFSYFASAKVNRFMEEYQNVIAIVFVVLVFTGAIDRPISYLQNGMLWIMEKLTFWVDPILNLIIK